MGRVPGAPRATFIMLFNNPLEDGARVSGKSVFKVDVRAITLLSTRRNSLGMTLDTTVPPAWLCLNRAQMDNFHTR